MKDGNEALTLALDYIIDRLSRMVFVTFNESLRSLAWAISKTGSDAYLDDILCAILEH